MITHDQFIKRWEGKRYRETGMKTYECVALAKKYAEEVYGIKGLSFGGSAINGWEKKGNLDNYFDRPDMPRQGDIVFFNKTPSNPYGHVAIHNDDFSILEQNGGVGGGTGLGVDAIRIHKAPSNYLGCMRPKPMDFKHYLQGSNPDCSLLSCINSYCLNNGPDSRSFTQEVVNELMISYINKTPKDAFQFLKDKKYKIRYLPLTFKGATARLNKGDAVIFFLRGETPRKSHYTVIRKEQGKYKVYDSTTPEVHSLDILNEKVLKDAHLIK